MRKGYVYILTNPRNTVLYIGMTNDLVRRTFEHKQKIVSGFSKKYNLTKLIYYEVFDSIETAIIREKQMKKWKRTWKEKLINEMNPDWDDLYESII